MLVRCLLVFVAFTSALLAHADPRKDIYGDPVPDGTLARLGTIRYRHPGHRSRHIEFLADNKTIVVGSEDSSIQLWDARSGKTVRQIDFSPMRLHASVVTPDGSAIAIVKAFYLQLSREYNVELRIEDAMSGEELTKIRWIEPMQDSTCCLTVSPRGDVVAVGTRSGKVRVLDRRDGKELKSTELDRGELQSMTFSPAGDRIALAGRRAVKQWKWQEDDLISFGDLARGGQVVAYLSDGDQLLVGADDQHAARIFDAHNGDLKQILQGKSGHYYYGSVGISPDNKRVAVPGQQEIEVFDLSTGQVERTLSGGRRPSSTAYSRDGQLLAWGSGSTVHVVDLSTGKQLNDRFEGHGEPAYELTFTPDGKQVVSAGMDGDIRIWDAATGRLEQTLRHDSGKWVSGLAVSPDGNQILSCALDDSVRLWDIDSSKQIFKLFGHGQTGGNRMTLSEFVEDDRLCSFGIDLYLRLYDRRTGKLLVEHAIRPSNLEIRENEDGEPNMEYGDPMGGLFSLGRPWVTPDGSRFLLSVQNLLFTFDTKTGKELRSMDIGNSRDFAVSPDGHRVAVAIPIRAANGQRLPPSQQRSNLRVYEIESGERILEKEILGSSTAVYFSPDARSILVQAYGESPNLGKKNWFSLYDAESGDLVGINENVDQRCSKFAFSPDGMRVAGSYQDTSILIWDVKQCRITDEHEQSKEQAEQ